MAIVSSNLRELGVVRIGTGRRALALSRVSNGKISPRFEGAIAPKYSNERTPKKRIFLVSSFLEAAQGFHTALPRALPYARLQQMGSKWVGHRVPAGVNGSVSHFPTGLPGLDWM